MKKNKEKKLIFLSHGEVATNRKARFDFDITETFEAGLVLTGDEVKSLRLGRCSLKESYVKEKRGELFLTGVHIPVYKTNGFSKPDEYRPRKLLMHKNQIDKLGAIANTGGKSIVPLKLYFNARGVAKLLIGAGTGKKQFDKRETIKERDWNRQKARLIKEN